MPVAKREQGTAKLPLLEGKGFGQGRNRCEQNESPKVIERRKVLP